MLNELANATFENPERLAALLLLPLVLLTPWRRLLGRPRRTAVGLLSIGLRMLLITGLIVAAARPVTHGLTGSKYVVALIDVSPSVGEAGREEAQTFAKGIRSGSWTGGFASVWFAEIAGEVTTSADLPAAPKTSAATNTDFTAALARAAASVPADRVPHFVLLSDGRFADRAAAAHAAEQLGYPISVKPLDAFPAGGVRMETPGRVAPSQDMDKLARASSETLRVRAFNMPLPKLSTEKAWAGDDGESVYRIRAGSASAYAFHRPPPPRKAIVLGEGESLRGPLERAGFAVASPATPAEFQIESVPLQTLVVAAHPSGQARTELLSAEARDWVFRGGKLIVFAGDEIFAAERFANSPLEDIMPVTAFERFVQPEEKTLALALVIDRSDSMKKERRMELAKLAAQKTVDLLGETDQLGVVVFGTDTEWIIELGPAADKTRLKRQIGQLEPAGVTNMFPAMRRAYWALEQTDADRRLCILITDGVPAPGDFVEVAERMKQAGVSVTTVSVGTGADQTILKDIAAAAGGKHFHAAQAADMPRILERETRAAVAETTAKAFRPIRLQTPPDMPTQNLPSVKEYTTTAPRREAHTLLAVGEGDPLLAWRRYGRGVTVAMPTGDLQPWHTWPHFEAFLGFLANLTAPPPTDEPLKTLVQREGDDFTLVAELLTETLEAPVGAGVRWRPYKRLRVTPHGSLEEFPWIDRTDESAPLSEIVPGRFEANVPIPLGEVWLVQVEASGREFGQARQVLAVDHSLPQERLVGETDEALLRAIAEKSGGLYDPTVSDIFALDQPRIEAVKPLWPYLLVACVVLWTLDIAVRQFLPAD